MTCSEPSIAAVAVLGVRNVYLIGAARLPDERKSMPTPCRIRNVKIALLLTGALHATKNQVHR